ncbi:MAG TPA: NAD(P)/FAD-dependent oxidoreductase [Terriglobales bacterium]|nr:NAD(P)/FAD-dependent oxidoreductase [Terriglobales bacterium]
MNTRSHRAVVVGSGPNGLAAAIVLAQAGLRVEVFEAEAVHGGGARTLELTLPGFHHDFGSAVHPMAAGSPFFTSLPLSDHGLEWMHSPAPLAHPLDDGTTVVLERNLDDAVREFGEDGPAWNRLMRTLVDHWSELAPELLSPLLRIPRHPFLLATFGLRALTSARSLANRAFRSERTKALFAGLAAHSFLTLDEPLTGAFAIMFGVTAHAVGWPIPRGGSQFIANALRSHLEKLGGTVKTSSRVNDLKSLGEFKVALCDVTPRQLLQIAGERFTPAYNRLVQRYRYGPGAFKVDYALSSPIPWRAAACSRAVTVHLGGTMQEVAESEYTMRHGGHAERPFVLLAQPTLFDSARAPAGKHIAWAYCHVPNGSTFDMLPRLEGQIERFAPGFRDCILQRRVFRPVDLEAMDANLVGGDINGGSADWRQFVIRPTWRYYSTPANDIYICSSSTPPGGGVHGMCGYNAAMSAVKKLMRNQS